jgi:4-carboxymuconolactone decarboxylase
MFKYNEMNTFRISYLRKLWLLLGAGGIALFSAGHAAGQEKKPMVRMARIVVDSAQLESYRVALKEGIETAVRVEPGVLTLFAVYEKDHPTHVTVLEVYADEAAYRAHLQTPHFRKYKSTTQNMVRSLELVDAAEIGFATKARN